MDDQLQKPKVDPKFIEIVDQKYFLFIIYQQYILWVWEKYKDSVTGILRTDSHSKQ